MQRLLAKRRSHHSISGGSNEVVAGISLPQGSVVHDIRGSVEYQIAGGTLQPMLRAFMIGIEGWILPVQDPDLGENFGDTFNRLVPKDTDVETIDEDTGALDTTPFWEIGEPDLTQIFDVGLRPRKVWGSYNTLTAATTRGVIVQDTETPFLFNWMPLARTRIRKRRSYRVSQPSVLVFAVGAAAGDDTTTTLEKALEENEWNRVMYIKDVLHEALRSFYGLTEAGAETPWEEAVTLIKQILEPDVFEETAATFSSANWEVITEMKFDYSVVGELQQAMLTSGRG